MHQFHFSIDDVLSCLLQMSDWKLKPTDQPMLRFLERLYEETGTKTDLYLFLQVRAADGRTRHLKELSAHICDDLKCAEHLRFGPHARDYETAPHAQTVDEAMTDMTCLFENIRRFSLAGQRSDWVRLHYFSELYELAPMWTSQGVKALMTTDKSAGAYRLDQRYIKQLNSTGRTDFNDLGFVSSNLRLEFFADDAVDPQRFCARMDEHFDRQGFITVFTHEDDMNDERIRVLALAAAKHAQKRGMI